ncbi:MAG: MarR family winged helix-turn-helix transcriptional regulator [Candidatus Methanomethylicaceae archaeon]|jgi:DNA-binding Lrp family transcriptional regulator
MVEKLPKEVATTVLLAIYRAGRMTMSEIQQKTKFSTITVLNHVNALVAAGLLAEEKEGVFPKRRIIKATAEGARVAGLLNMADRSLFSATELIDMGAKAGRIAAYHEEIASMRKVNVTKEYLIAELLLKGVSLLSGGLAAVAKGLPEEMAEKRVAVQAWSTKLEANYNEGLKRLGTNDYNGAVGGVSRALSDFNGSAETLKSVRDRLNEMKLQELANYVEFLSPNITHKE